MPRLWFVISCLSLVACGRNSPQPPVVSDPGPATVNGTERIGWDQPAADAVALTGIGYVVYVDGTRTDLAGVACASSPAAVGFACTAKLPAMSAGAHTLELASLVNDGGVRESARSAPLRVTLTAQTVSSANRRAAALRPGLSLRDTPLADDLDSPSDIAFAPDGRIFVAERAGRIRILRPSTGLGTGDRWNEPALDLTGTLGTSGQLLAIAVDPQFARTRDVFAVYTSPGRSGDAAFTLARFREVSNTLGDRAVLLDGVSAASPLPSAALRFGPDGKLYAALDDGGDVQRRRDPASFNGKVLRLNTDGTTPGDAAGATPIFAMGYGAPVALDWDPQAATLWVADRAAGGSAFAFYRGALFPAWAGRMLSADALFTRAGAPAVSVIATGPDGAVYYGTARALGRLAPDRGP